MKRTLLVLSLFVAASAQAQNHGTHGAATSPYAGQEAREIKSLSTDDIAELRKGGGWGLAKAAELNGVPGPAHLLELKREIPLAPDQVSKIEAIFADMKAKAIVEGERLIAREKALEAAFRTRAVDDASLRRLLGAVEESRAALRYIHLSAHLTTPALLSREQLARYVELRGYGADPCASVPAGHDPKMWRLHNGCR